MFFDRVDGRFEVFARPVRLKFDLRAIGALPTQIFGIDLGILSRRIPDILNARIVS